MRWCAQAFDNNRKTTFDLARMRRTPAAALHKISTSVEFAGLLKISLEMILRAPIPTEQYTGGEANDWIAAAG